MEKLTVVKVGGKVIDSESQLSAVLSDFSQIEGKKILVHGGGSMASQFAKKLGIETKMVEGRRVTDADSLEIVTMIYAGLINKKIVASLHATGCDAIGLSGADGNSIRSHKRHNANIDYGFVGDIDEVNASMIIGLLKNGHTPVFSAITHDKKGQLLNTNADTVASSIASALTKEFNVKLLITFEHQGVLSNPDKSDSVIPIISEQEFVNLLSRNIISDGMIPKLTNGFNALKQGVAEVVITSFTNICNLNSPHTKLVHS